MILVAGGDSFIWGSELKDSPHGGPDGYSCSTFSALLAKHNNMEYVCVAYPGIANNAISRKVLDSLCNISGDKFLLVQWTFPQRVEFRFEDTWKSINSWHTEYKEFSHSYFKYVGNNEYYEIYSVLKEIVFVQNYCLLNCVPFMFTTSNNHFYDHENYYRRQDVSLENLYNQIKWDRWYFFPKGREINETVAPRGFYQWAIENKYTVGPQQHPLEEAHQDAYELIKGKFNELVKKNN